MKIIAQNENYWKDKKVQFKLTRISDVEALTNIKFIMELFGCNICAIFPNRDVFIDETRRESNVLLTSYLNPTICEFRNSVPILTVT